MMGPCATTCIWTVLGKENDPLIRIVTDQVKSWIDLIQDQDLVQTSKAWWDIKAKFYGSPTPWATIKGPTGAIIGTLDYVGWKPISPLKWVDEEGSIRRFQKGCCYQQLINGIRESAQNIVWNKAAQHRHGNGLQQGADLTVLIKHKQMYNNRQEN